MEICRFHVRISSLDLGPRGLGGRAPCREPHYQVKSLKNRMKSIKIGRNRPTLSEIQVISTVSSHSWIGLRPHMLPEMEAVEWKTTLQSLDFTARF